MCNRYSEQNGLPKLIINLEEQYMRFKDGPLYHPPRRQVLALLMALLRNRTATSMYLYTKLFPAAMQAPRNLELRIKAARFVNVNLSFLERAIAEIGAPMVVHRFDRGILRYFRLDTSQVEVEVILPPLNDNEKGVLSSAIEAYAEQQYEEVVDIVKGSNALETGTDTFIARAALWGLRAAAALKDHGHTAEFVELVNPWLLSDIEYAVYKDLLAGFQRVVGGTAA